MKDRNYSLIIFQDGGLVIRCLLHTGCSLARRERVTHWLTVCATVPYPCIEVCRRWEFPWESHGNGN